MRLWQTGHSHVEPKNASEYFLPEYHISSQEPLETQKLEVLRVSYFYLFI